MSWEPRHDKLYIDGVLIQHRVQRTPNGEWEDYVPEEPPPVKKAHMKAFSRQPIYYAETKTVDKQDGMDLRDYFAAQMLASVFSSTSRNKPSLEAVAKAAYEMADAMMKAREEK